MGPVGRRNLLGLYLLDGLAYLTFWATGYRIGELVAKPALMLVLAGYVSTTRWAPRSRSVGLLVVAGLVFAAAGDTALLFTGTVALLAGMGLFLVTQVCYLLAWLNLGASQELRRRWWIALPYLAALVVLAVLVSNRVPEALVLGMIVYSVVEYASAALAIVLRLSLGIGATLFAASDALIGLRIAHFTIPGDEYAVMVLYAAAQLLIAVSTLGIIRVRAVSSMSRSK